MAIRRVRVTFHRLSAILIGALIATAGLVSSGYGQDQPATPVEGAVEPQKTLSPEEIKANEARNMASMRVLAETIEVVALSDAGNKSAQRIDKPLARFSDPSRAHSDGSVWAWSFGGRPIVMAELRTSDFREELWGHDLVATHPTNVAADLTGFGQWAPAATDFEIKPFPGAPKPGDTEATRLRQMKSMVRRLSADQQFNGNHADLRIQPNPILRYKDAEAKVIDGAAFAFVNGTNPELIVFTEARQPDGQPVEWTYGLARMSAAEIHCRVDDQEIFTVPQTFGNRATSYFAFTRPVPGVAPDPGQAPTVDRVEIVPVPSPDRVPSPDSN